MGFFDKVRDFAGGHGVKATFTRVERQDPASARFPVTDSVVKANVEVTGDKEQVVLAHVYEVYAECKAEGKLRLIKVAEDRHDASTKIIGGEVTWPYTLAPGQVVRDGCCIIRVDLAKAFREMGVNDPAEAVGNKDYRVFLRFTADVKGSPMDARVEADLILTA
ncbi:MAG: hypothetical protein ACK4YP_18135 [Myxococcota bacterium]